MNLTGNELDVLINGILKADHRDLNGPRADVWVDCIEDMCSVSGKTLSGVVSSLAKKGLIITDGETIGLTDLAVETLKHSPFIDMKGLEILNRSE